MIITEYRVVNKTAQTVARGAGLLSSFGIDLITGNVLGGAVLGIGAVNPLLGVCAYIGAVSLGVFIGKKSAEAVKETVETAAAEILHLDEVKIEV